MLDEREPVGKARTVWMAEHSVGSSVCIGLGDVAALKHVASCVSSTVQVG